MGMTIDDLRKIIAALTAGQGRQFTEADVDLWDNLLKDLDGSLAYEAVINLMRNDGGFITPASVRQECKRIASERLDAVDQPPTPPSGLNAEQYRTWLKAVRQSIVHGQPAEQAARDGRLALGLSVQAPALTAGSGNRPNLSWARSISTGSEHEIVDGRVIEG